MPRTSDAPKVSEKPSPRPAVSGGEPKFSPAAVLKNQKGQIDISLDTGSDQAVAPVEPTGPSDQEPLTLEKVKSSWDAITYAVSREKMSVATYLQEGSPYELNHSTLVIGFPKHAQFQKESLEDKTVLRMVEKVFADKLKTAIKLEFRTIDNDKPQEDEPFVKSALDTFKGKVISKWHKD